MAPSVPDRRRDAAHAVAPFAAVDGIAELALLLELVAQLVRRGDRVGRERLELERDLVDQRGRCVGEQRLAGGHAVRRGPTADPRIGPHRVRAVDLVEVDHLRAFEHRQVNRFTGQLAQALHVLDRHRLQVEPTHHRGAQLPQLQRQLVLAALLEIADVAAGHQRLQQAVRIALGQPQVLRQLCHARQVGVRRQCLDHLEAFHESGVHARSNMF